MPGPVFTSESRLMLIAPHPDDEALACSVILQRAIRAGAAIHVLYATDGEDNPWPQRVLERKWRLDATDRKRWGELRRTEALAALQVLGISPSNTCFLGLPDQRLTHLLTTDSRCALQHFARSITDLSPTHLLVPSIRDTHPDHNAVGVLLRVVLAQSCADATLISLWAYAVHGKSHAFFDHAHRLSQSTTEGAIKEEAIRCHKTQLKLSRRRFLAYVTRPECFLQLQSRESTVADGPVHWISRESRILRLQFSLSAKPMRAAGASLFVLGRDLNGTIRCVRTSIPVHSLAVEMFDCHSRGRVDVAQYRGDAFAGEFAIPVDIFSPAHPLFVKLERRLWFFDEAGWLETPPTVAETTLTRVDRTRSMRSKVLS